MSSRLGMSVPKYGSDSKRDAPTSEANRDLSGAISRICDVYRTVDHTRISDSGALILGDLIRQCGETGRCITSPRALSDTLGIGRRTIQRAMITLELRGFIRREPFHGSTHSGSPASVITLTPTDLRPEVTR